MSKRTPRQFASLAWLTAIEILRQPLCLLLTVSSVLFISVMPLVITHSLGEADKLVRDSALAVVFTAGLLLGGYAACSTFSQDFRRGTAAVILSKPVGRGLFFLAKFAGVCLVMLLFCLTTLVATMMSTRMAADSFVIDWWAGVPLLAAPPLALLLAGLLNYLTRRPFASAGFAFLTFLLLLAFFSAGFVDARGAASPFGQTYFWPLLPVGVLITFAVILLSAMAVSLATRLDVVPTIAVCGLIFFAGLVSDYLFGRHADSSALAGLLYVVIPNWQHFWVVDALSLDHGVPWSYVAEAGLYGFWYLCGLLSLGLLGFRTMDVRR